MKLNFRQGIVRAPQVSNQPSFLGYNSGMNSISLTNTELVRVTAAHTTANYLIEERNQVAVAWGPLVWNPAWGTDPLAYTFYLYWDVNPATGAVTRGFSPSEPTYGDTRPVTPSADLHWFDTVNKQMWVYAGVDADLNDVWVKKIRVFAGSWVGGTNNITEYPFGTQVELEVDSDHGYILYSMDMNAVRGADGTFVTTATDITTNHGSFASPIRLELAASTMLALEPIPAFSCVANLGDDTAVLASGTDIAKRPIGVVLVDSDVGDPVDVVTNGIVYNDGWTWDVLAGKDVYCGPTGELVQGDPLQTTGEIRVGTILSPTSILVDVDLYGVAVDNNVGPTGPQGVSGYSGTPSNVTGPAGTSGYSGAVGPTGPQGDSGFSGVDGAAGPTGPQGTSGYSGVVGTSGYSGVAGTNATPVPTGVTTSLPAATTPGELLYVTDANGGGGTIAFANGSIWIDIKTGVLVSV